MRERNKHIEKMLPSIPPSLVPVQDHIEAECDVAPLGSAEEPLYRYDKDKRRWVMKVFPSLFPAGKKSRTPRSVAAMRRSQCLGEWRRLRQAGETCSCWRSG